MLLIERTGPASGRGLFHAGMPSGRLPGGPTCPSRPGRPAQSSMRTAQSSLRQDRSGRSSSMTRAQLTDAAWTFVEPLLPIGRFGPYPGRLRQQFEGVIWRFRTGGQWREMPTEPAFEGRGDGEEGVGEQCEGGPGVPGAPASHLMFGKTRQSLGTLKHLLHWPATARDRDQGAERGGAGRIAAVVGQLPGGAVAAVQQVLVSGRPACGDGHQLPVLPAVALSRRVRRTASARRGAVSSWPGGGRAAGRPGWGCGWRTRPRARSPVRVSPGRLEVSGSSL